MESLFEHSLSILESLKSIFITILFRLISKGKFMQTKHLCVLIYILTKVGASWNRLKTFQ